MPIDDPVEVKEQYAREDNLRARQALWQGATGTDPKQVLWRTIESRDTLVAYRDSIAVPTSEVPENVPLPFVVHGRTSIFFATT